MKRPLPMRLRVAPPSLRVAPPELTPDRVELLVWLADQMRARRQLGTLEDDIDG